MHHKALQLVIAEVRRYIRVFSSLRPQYVWSWNNGFNSNWLQSPQLFLNPGIITNIYPLRSAYTRLSVRPSLQPLVHPHVCLYVCPFVCINLLFKQWTFKIFLRITTRCSRTMSIQPNVRPSVCFYFCYFFLSLAKIYSKWSFHINHTYHYIRLHFGYFALRKKYYVLLG